MLAWPVRRVRCVLHCTGCLRRPRRRPAHHRFVPVEISNRKSFVRFHSHPTPPTLTSDLMPTVASSAHPQRPPPGDADLQELYDQVLSAFADESSPSNFSPTFSISMSNNVDRDDSLYSPHSDEGVASQISARTHPHSRRQSFAPLFFLSLIISLSFPPSLRQSSRQHSLAPLPNNLLYFSGGQGPSSPTKASWILA